MELTWLFGGTGINPFTALACKISGLKGARRHLQTAYFRVYNPSTFNAMRFDEKPFTSRCEKEKERLTGFKFRTIIGRFQVTSWQ